MSVKISVGRENIVKGIDACAGNMEEVDDAKV